MTTVSNQDWAQPIAGATSALRRRSHRAGVAAFSLGAGLLLSACTTSSYNCTNSGCDVSLRGTAPRPISARTVAPQSSWCRARTAWPPLPTTANKGPAPPERRSDSGRPRSSAPRWRRQRGLDHQQMTALGRPTPHSPPHFLRRKCDQPASRCDILRRKSIRSAFMARARGAAVTGATGPQPLNLSHVPDRVAAGPA